MWFVIRVVYQCGLSSGWSVTTNTSVVSSMWFVISVVSHQGGLLPLIPVWSHQCGLSGWSFINMLSLIKVISYLGFQWVETNTAGLWATLTACLPWRWFAAHPSGSVTRCSLACWAQRSPAATAERPVAATSGTPATTPLCPPVCPEHSSTGLPSEVHTHTLMYNSHTHNSSLQAHKWLVKCGHCERQMDGQTQTAGWSQRWSDTNKQKIIHRQTDEWSDTDRQMNGQTDK